MIFSCGFLMKETVDRLNYCYSFFLSTPVLVVPTLLHAEAVHIPVDRLFSCDRFPPTTLALRMLYYLALRKLMLSCTEVARHLNISNFHDC